MPPKPPIALVTAPSSVRLGETFTVDASGSVDGAGGGGITKYHYNFGDGTTESSTSATATHAYTDIQGQPFLCRVTVRNKKGRSDTSPPVSVEVVAEAPPPPVDCVLGDEFITSETPLEVCQPDGFQAVEVAWMKPVLVEPANGGEPCGVRSGTRIEKRACVYVPPPDPEPEPDPVTLPPQDPDILTPPGPDDYSEMLAARPDCLYSWPLASQAEIDSYKSSGAVPPRLPVVYDAIMRAARQEINPPVTGFNKPQQKHLPLLILPGTSFLLMWWHCFSEGWIYKGDGYLPDAEKTYRFDLPTGSTWLALKHFFKTGARRGVLADYRVTHQNGQYVIEPSGTHGDPAQDQGGEAIGPQVQFWQIANRWTLSALYYDAPNQQLSFWAGDRVQGLVQKLDRVGYGFPPEGIKVVRLEDDTSFDQTPAKNPQAFHWNRRVTVNQIADYDTAKALVMVAL